MCRPAVRLGELLHLCNDVIDLSAGKGRGGGRERLGAQKNWPGCVVRANKTETKTKAKAEAKTSTKTKTRNKAKARTRTETKSRQLRATRSKPAQRALSPSPTKLR